MKLVLEIGAVLLFVWVLYDLFITVFKMSGAGPLTRLWTRGVWRVLLGVHRWKPIHGVLSFAGALMLPAGILLWYLLLAGSCFILFWLNPGSVVNGSTGAVVGEASRIFYFVNTMLTGLGFGDLIPAGMPWTWFGIFSTLISTMLITVTLSYVLAVLSAAIERRKLARSLYGLGEDPAEVVENAFPEAGGVSMDSYFVTKSEEILEQALKQKAYPILKFLHSSHRRDSPCGALLMLSDAFFLVGHLPDSRRKPAPGVQRLVTTAIRHYVEGAARPVCEPPPEMVSHQELERAVDRLGIQRGKDFEQALNIYRDHRRHMLGLCREDGWEWNMRGS